MNLLKEKKFTEINTVWQKVLGIGSGQKGIDCFDDLSLIAGFEDGQNFYGREGIIPTMFPTVDEWLRGGAARKELHVVVAPPNMGKSRLLRNIGYNACVQGKKVLCITAEMQEAMCREQLWQRMSGLTIEELHTDVGKAKVREKADMIHSRGGRFHIKYMDPYTYTMNHIESYMIRTGESWDMLITDYLDLFLLAGDRTGSYWMDQTKMYAEGRKLANRMNVTHWSASQPVDVDQGDLITLRKMGGSKGKGATVDSMWSMNATAQEELEGKFSLFNGKNRVGPARKVVGMRVVPEKMYVCEIPKTIDVGLGDAPNGAPTTSSSVPPAAS